jgi:hypothetical protein
VTALVILALEVAGGVAFIAAWTLFYVYVTDSDPGRQPRLKRAMVCWWYHRWHRDRFGGWGRHFCSSCVTVEYGRRRMDRKTGVPS